MTNALAIAFGFASIAVMLGAVLGAVEYRGRTVFVAGVVLLVVASLLVGAGLLSAPVGGGLALVGVLALLASTVPLLRQSPTTA